MRRDLTKTTMAATTIKEVLVTRESINTQYFEKHLKRCFEGEMYADVELVCQGVHIKANLSVLASASPKLRHILKDFQTDPKVTIIMAGFSLTEIMALLEYAYTGDITCLTQKNVEGFRNLAETFDLVISDIHENSPEESLCIFDHFLYQSDAEMKHFERKKEIPDTPLSVMKNESARNSIQEEEITQQLEVPESAKKNKKKTSSPAKPSKSKGRVTEDTALHLLTPVITLTPDAGHANKKIQCDVCNKKFPSNTHLKRHGVRAHQNKTPIKTKVKCGVCNGMFLPSYLKKHISRFHSKSFSCVVCQYNFPGKKSLLKHQNLWKHHQSSPSKSEESSISSKSIIDQAKDATSNVTPTASTTHSHSKLYTCAICQQRFNAKKALFKHSAALHKSSPSKSILKKEVHVFR